MMRRRLNFLAGYVVHSATSNEGPYDSTIRLANGGGSGSVFEGEATVSASVDSPRENQGSRSRRHEAKGVEVPT